MQSVKQEIDRIDEESLREWIEEENRIDVKHLAANPRTINKVLNDLADSMYIVYENEFNLAKKVGLLNVIYSDGNWRNTIYNVKGIPFKSLIENYR